MKEQLVHKQLLLKRTLPKNVRSEDVFLFREELEKTLNEVFLIKENNITINNGHLVYNSHSELLKSFSPVFSAPTNIISKFKFGVKNVVKKKVALSGSYYWISDAWGDGYSHWLTDCLQRLICIVNVLGPGCVLLPESYRDKTYISDTLKAFSCDSEYFKNDHKIHVQELITCTSVAGAGNYNPQIMKQVRDKLKASALINYLPEKSETNVYISRAKAAKRKVKNECGIKEILQKYDFKFIHIEDMSWVEKIRLMASARNIVSIHGAGLTNCIFMRSGGNLFELRRIDDNVNNCYFSLADAMDLNYYYQLCDFEAENLHVSDLNVDPILFEKNLLKMLCKPH